MVSLFVLVLFVVLNTNGQGSDNPILPRVYENGYSIGQIERFAQENTEYSRNYRSALLYIVNLALQKSGEYLNFNEGNSLVDKEKDINLIYSYVVRKQNGYLPSGYRNTYRNNNFVVPYKSKSPYFGAIDQFVFGSCVVNLDKPSCANLLGDMDKVQITQIVKTKPTINYVPEPVFTPKKSIENSPYIYVKPLDILPKKEESTNKIQFKNGNLLFWKIAIPVVAMGVGVYFLTLTRQKNVYVQDPGGPAPVPGHDAGGPVGAPGHN